MASGDPRNTSRPDTGSSASEPSPSKKPPAKPTKGGSSRKMTAKEQSERFIATAREIEADETGAAFDAAIGKVLIKRQT